ncbi:MAG TPA: MFS transporter [Candidatus Dorea intestinavium]|nr:MFS transporter [Candidatus Dorea intestinavium]
MEKKGSKYSIGFWACASTEIFERLAYYLGRSLILIFVTTAVVNGGLGLSDSVGAKMQANLTAFAYLGPVLGGVIVDRFIGARYTTPFGMIVVAIGYFMGSIAKGPGMIYGMIICVSLGLGLFRTAPLIGRLVGDKSKMDSAFSIRYTLVNTGAFIGTFLVGILYKDVFAKNGVLGFAPCFRLAALSMVIGAVWFIFSTRFMGNVGKKPFKSEKTKEELEEEAKQKEANKELKKMPMTTIEKKRIGAIILVSAFSIVFWIFWYLAYLPVYYHWAENMNWVVAGYEVPATWFDAANSMFCIILGPITAKLWGVLAARPKGDMSLFRKTGIGIGILGLGYIFYAIIDITRGSGKASVLALIVFAFLLTLGEMFFSPLGHSFISKYSPSRYLGVMISVWGIATFIAGKSYGYVYEFAFGGSFKFYSACIVIAIIAFVSALILFVLDKKLSGLVED